MREKSDSDSGSGSAASEDFSLTLVSTEVKSVDRDTRGWDTCDSG